MSKIFIPGAELNGVHGVSRTSLVSEKPVKITRNGTQPSSKGSPAGLGVSNR
jgi:hypothetical protein